MREATLYYHKNGETRVPLKVVTFVAATTERVESHRCVRADGDRYMWGLGFLVRGWLHSRSRSLSCEVCTEERFSHTTAPPKRPPQLGSFKKDNTHDTPNRKS